jgi:hypothetical protein
MRFVNIFLILSILSYLQIPDCKGEGFDGPEEILEAGHVKDTLSFFENASEPHRGRTHLIGGAVLGLYPISMYWLYTQWYKDYPQSSFHFFNDNSEWEYMDKYAHTWDAYSIAKPLMRSFHWAGQSNKNSTFYACGISFLYQTTIEVFDGFSSEWGFSGGDVLANMTGIGTFAFQQLLWEEQRIVLKYSFHQTKYSKYRPELLGSSLPENILKDYNGLTYWLNVNPRSWMSKDSRFPKWLSIGVGIGAEGMTGGKSNPLEVDGKPIPEFERYTQYYLSVDLDFSRVDFRSKFLNSFFKVINIIHLPAPAVEFSKGRKTSWHLIYF